MRLIEGNHDRAAARAALNIERSRDGVDEGPFTFAHAPDPMPQDGARFRVCGHLHPVVSVPGFRGRFAAFAVIDRQLVLPAFSLFTGGWQVRTAQARIAQVVRPEDRENLERYVVLALDLSRTLDMGKVLGMVRGQA